MSGNGNGSALTDKEKAAEYKDRLAKALEPVCELLTAAKAEGIILQFNLGSDARGHSFVSTLAAVKEL